MRGRPFAQTWTPAEVDKLREVFPVLKRKRELMAALPGHSWSGIGQKARSLGLRKKYAWSVQEIDILRDNYEVMPWRELKALLPRRAWANVQKKASALGLSRNIHKDASPFRIVRELRRIRRARGIECEELAKKFGVYGSTISAWECATKNKSAPHLKSLMDWADALGFDIWLKPRETAAGNMSARNAQRSAPLKAGA